MVVEDLLQRLHPALERLVPGADPRALADALSALGLEPTTTAAHGDAATDWLAALALAIAACWTGGRPRVIALERWLDLPEHGAGTVIATLERVAAEGHGIWLRPDGADRRRGFQRHLVAAGAAW